MAKPVYWTPSVYFDETQFHKFLATEGETIAEFRAQHNISDIWVEWSFLTEHEKEAELYFTPRFWEANCRYWQDPPSFTRTPVKNTRGESLSFFYPADHESDRAYVFEIDGDYISQPVHRDFSPKNQTEGLQLFEDTLIGQFFALTQLPQLDLYTLTQLLLPTNNVVLF